MLNYQQLDPEYFNLKPCVIAGDECLLIGPKDITVKWTKETLNYRSVIVRKSDGEVLSASWPKFYNYLEQSHLYPNPLDYKDWYINEKIDGSTILVSKCKDQLIVRTRGVVDAFQHDSGPELKELLSENPKIIDNKWVNSEEITLIFEHCSVFNQIVIKHEKPKLVLIGAIWHKDYQIIPNYQLTSIADEIGVEMPKQFQFNSLEEIVENCKVLKGIEGYVMAFNNFANRIKLKGSEYLFLHKAKSEISNFEKVIDLFLISNSVTFEQFYSFVESHLDHELAEMAKVDIKEITEINTKVVKLIGEISEVVSHLRSLPRKEAALTIIKLYGADQLTSYAFNLLNGKELESKHRKDLILKLRK